MNQQTSRSGLGKKITGLLEISQEIAEEIKKDVNNASDFKQKIGGRLGENVTEVLEIILGGSINLGASDVHIEPKEETNLRKWWRYFFE